MRKRGILLVNLGSPDSPSVSDVRKYLREFLMDPRVLDVPYPIRFAIVHGWILPRRPRASAEAYAKIWTEQGSPLVTISASLQRRLQERTGLPVELGMRYQKPTIESALARLIAAGVDEALVAPLFPHNAKSSYGSAVERVKQVAAKTPERLRLSILPPYYDRPEYIEALVATASPYLEQEHDHLLFSFHGVPQRHLRKANPDCRDCLSRPDCSDPGAASRDCYRRHCLETMNRFVAVTGLASGSFSFAFQSRLGVDAWLKPSYARSDRSPRRFRCPEADGYLSGIYRGLPGNNRGDRNEGERSVSRSGRQRVHPYSMPERSPGLGRRPGAHGLRLGLLGLEAILIDSRAVRSNR